MHSIVSVTQAYFLLSSQVLWPPVVKAEEIPAHEASGHSRALDGKHATSVSGGIVEVKGGNGREQGHRAGGLAAGIETGFSNLEKDGEQGHRAGGSAGSSQAPPVQPPDLILSDMDVFGHCLVLYVCQRGMPRVLLLQEVSHGEGSGEGDRVRVVTVPLPDAVTSVIAGGNSDYGSDTLRLIVSSPIVSLLLSEPSLE